MPVNAAHGVDQIGAPQSAERVRPVSGRHWLEGATAIYCCGRGLVIGSRGAPVVWVPREEQGVAVVSRGFEGRRRQPGAGLTPPGQYLVDDFPVLTAGPTPDVALED